MSWRRSLLDIAYSGALQVAQCNIELAVTLAREDLKLKPILHMLYQFRLILKFTEDISRMGTRNIL